MNDPILFLYYEIFLIHIQDQLFELFFQVTVLLEELIDYLNLNTEKLKENHFIQNKNQTFCLKFTRRVISCMRLCKVVFNR